jgi:DNA repair protein RadA/Sms
MKAKIYYVCKNCGYKSAKWQGKCSSCGEWDTLVEETDKRDRNDTLKKVYTAGVTKLSEVSDKNSRRIKTNIREFDRVLGGGIIPGSFILVGGDPGIGKSTLLLQMCGSLVGQRPLYVTGEESLEQIKHRASRIENIPGELDILAETNAETIESVIHNTDNDVIVIDSIQSIYSDRIDATPGSIIQVRECAALFQKAAKGKGKSIFIIGHVTKEGIIAGPKLLEHMVDTVLQFEGEKTYSYRILRSLKNRFGSTNEIGIFEMTETGMQEVVNPSGMFLVNRHSGEHGIAISAAMEGTRPILLEVQALVAFSGYGMPQRNSTGFDSRRLQMILAVLEKRLGLNYRQNDVFVNVTGGAYFNDTSMDLGIAAALVSSFKEKPIRDKCVLIGEIGLTGEIRPVPMIEQRISEAEKMGFESVYVPAASFGKLGRKFGIKINPVEKISLALMELF